MKIRKNNERKKKEEIKLERKKRDREIMKYQWRNEKGGKSNKIEEKKIRKIEKS